MIATDRPPSAIRPAQTSPEEPAPTTITSNSLVLTPSALQTSPVGEGRGATQKVSAGSGSRWRCEGQ